MAINKINIFSVILLLSLSQVSNTTEQQANGQNGQNYNEVNGDVNNKRVATMRLTNIKNEIKIAPEHKISTNILNKINYLIIPKKLGFSEIFYSYKNKNFYIKNHKTNKIYNLKKTTNNFNYIKIYNIKKSVKNSHTVNKNTYYNTSNAGDIITINNSLDLQLGFSYSDVDVIYKTQGKNNNSADESNISYNSDLDIKKNVDSTHRDIEVDDYNNNNK